jgi:hypothetical protein
VYILIHLHTYVSTHMCVNIWKFYVGVYFCLSLCQPLLSFYSFISVLLLLIISHFYSDCFYQCSLIIYVKLALFELLFQLGFPFSLSLPSCGGSTLYISVTGHSSCPLYACIFVCLSSVPSSKS